MDNNKTIIIAAVAAFVIGLLIGNVTVGGKSGDTSGLTQLLDQAIQAAEKMEGENERLKADLKQVKGDKIRKENEVLQQKLNAMQKDNENLKSELAGLRAQLSDAENRLKTGGEFKDMIEGMKKRISELENENQDLKNLLDKIGSLTKEQEAGGQDQQQ